MASDPFPPSLRSARFFPPFTVGPRVVRLMRAMDERARRPGPEVVDLGDGVSVHVHRPVRATAPGPALLWIHGGGFVTGSAWQDDELCRGFADDLGIVVASVDYRLAPEHPFPTPVHDGYRGLEWLAGQAAVDASRIAIGGMSAGAGLAASLTLLAVERREITPAFQSLTYPMLDDRTVVRTDLDTANVRIWSPGSNRFGWTSYLGTEPGGDDVPPLAAPARYADLSGLPPTWIGVGTNDLFHDEDVAWAARLREAGVECELDVVPGAYHGFDAVQANAAASREFAALRIAALRRALL